MELSRSALYIRLGQASGVILFLMWLIRRTYPLGLRYGYAIPVFIWNDRYHLTTVDAFSDGAIDVWDMVDLNLFDGKLDSGWICPRPPNGARLSVFDLGYCTASDAEWMQTADFIRQRVRDAVQKLNPRLEDLIDMQGSDKEVRGNVRWAKLGSANELPCRIESDGRVITAKEVSAFEIRGEGTFLTPVFIFADGLARIGSDSELIASDEVFRRFDDGVLTTSVSDGTRVIIDEVGSFICTQGSWRVKPAERVRELRGDLAWLNGSRTLVQICGTAQASYEKDPSAQNLDLLRAAYEAVPEHLRKYCGDMDEKDHPIRKILFPSEYERP